MTRDFGHELLGATRIDDVHEDETVMRLLRSEFDIDTRYGGRFVQAIDGLEGSGAAASATGSTGSTGSRGASAPRSSSSRRATACSGTGATGEPPMRVPAIVGAYPEPFVHGLEGKRRPVRVECEDSTTEPCRDARAVLEEAGASPSGASLGAPGTETITRLAVAPWPEVRIVRGASGLEEGPETTGVFARFDREGRSIELLDEQGEVARTVRPGDGVGLVLALRPLEEELVWLATGLDDEGVAAAVRALTEKDLRDAFAVAVAGPYRGEAAAGEPMSLIPVYRPRPSALHAARAGVGASFCCALALTGALYRHPLVLLATLGAVVAAGLLAGVGREMGRSLLLALPLALLVTIVNPLVYAEGDTLLVRGGEFLGRRFDITLEAILYGALTGLRVMTLVVALGLLSAAVDPDELLRIFRRVSYRSALTASLANRLVPVLARDAMRMSDAARCRPTARRALRRRARRPDGALDRSVDVAAGARGARLLARRPARRGRGRRGRGTTSPSWGPRSRSRPSP